MRIAYIGDGGSIHNHFMVDWFRQRGHEVLFLTDQPDEAIQCEMVQVAPSPGGGPWRHIKAIINTRKALREWKPDIVHAHNITGYGYWAACTGFSPFMMTSWGSDLLVYPQQNPLVRWAVEFSLRKADWVTADAESLCEAAREIVGDKIEVRLLQWGVDPSQFDQSLGEQALLQWRGDAEVVFISNRRLRPIYNIDVILRAFAQALPRMPKVRLLVVGDDTERGKLEALSRELGIHEHTVFVGWLPQEELHMALLASDVYVSVPSSDSTALSLLEAFAARLPVIVADLPASREWVQAGGNGLLVPPGEVEALAGAMRELAGSQEKRRLWGEINRGIVEERGNREKEMRKLEQWYVELCQHG